MSYADIHAAVHDTGFQGRCLVAVWKKAQEIVMEDTSTPDYWPRKDWAMRMLQERQNITARQVAMQVLRNSEIADAPNEATDEEIQSQVNSIVADLISIG